MPVQVAWDRGRHVLRVQGEGVDAAVPASHLSLDRGGWRGEAVHLVWPQEAGHAAVSVDDGPSLAALERTLPPDLAEQLRQHRRAAAREHRRSRIVLGCLAVAVLGVVAAVVTLVTAPALLLDPVVSALPTDVDVAVGRAVEQSVVARDRYDDPVVEQAVERIGQRLVAAAPPSPFRFRFHVVDDPTVNAFAVPGGVVVVHTGLLRAARSADEVAGVLAHEIAHVLERHSLHALAQRLGLWATVELVVGGADSAAGGLANAATTLSGLRYGRDQERAADRLGLQILRAAEVSPERMIDFFTRMGADDRAVPDWLATHPDSVARAADLRARLARLPAAPTRPLQVDWPAVQRALRR